MIKLKATYKKCIETDVTVKPVFFPRETGLQYKALTGYKSSSIFAISESELNFTTASRVKLFFIKRYYWLVYKFWRYVRHQLPHKIKMRFMSKNNKNYLPF